MWKNICKASELDQDQGVSVTVDGKEIGVFLVDEKPYAIADICPHAYARLSQGFVDGDTVECPLHEAVFEIKTGKCTKGPGSDVSIYPIQIVDGQVQIQL